ncbi:MAG: cell division protein FtsI (penicillin-binding protein 3), partial [Loktanella salsilacus]
MIRTPLRPLARILKARERGEDPGAIAAENLRLRHEAIADKSRARAEGRLLVLGAFFAVAFLTIGLRMGTIANSAPEEPRTAA